MNPDRLLRVNNLGASIALNLMLCICFGLNPVTLRGFPFRLYLESLLRPNLDLERWYIGVSVFLGLFIPSVPAALGHFGWDQVQVNW